MFRNRSEADDPPLPAHYRGLRSTVAPADPWPVSTAGYGALWQQVGDLRLPDSPPPHPLVVMFHGGFWSAPWDRRLMNAVGDRLARAGVASWNVEFRRLGLDGGWPATFDDAAAGLAMAVQREGVDHSRIGLLGHSAGGQLALWLAADHPGLCDCVVALAPVTDLVRASNERVGGGVVAQLMGGRPDERAERYARHSPRQRLPLGVAQLLLHGGADSLVPPSHSRDYCAAARTAGDECVLISPPLLDHMAPLRGAAELDPVLEWFRLRWGTAR